MAASRSMLNLEVSQIAQRKATLPDVKYLAQAIVAGRTAMQTELKALADRKSIVLPASLGNDEAKQVGELTALNGASFDRRYLDLLDDVHDQSVDAFDDMSEDAYDGDIRAFAAKYLPTLKSHREAAEKAADHLPK